MSETGDNTNPVAIGSLQNDAVGAHDALTAKIHAALDGRIGRVKDYSAPTFPSGENGPPHLAFGFLTTENENGVFYVDLTQADGIVMAGLVVAAHARKMSAEIVFEKALGELPPTSVDPSGFVRGIRLVGVEADR